MKKLQIMFVAALCGMVYSVSAQSGSPAYATVVRVEGLASYSLGAGQPEHPLVAGKVLAPGATIHTKDNGVVDVVLGKAVAVPGRVSPWQPAGIGFAPDQRVRGMVSYQPTVEQNIVRLTPNTTLGIDKLTVMDTGADTVSDTELDLKKGKIYARVKKLTNASQYLIKLPNGIAGVRGTWFSISADGTVSVLESSGSGLVISLVMPDGTTQTYTVLAGQFYVPGSSSPLALPPEVISQLEPLFSALGTTYVQLANFSFDSTRLYVSPTQGYR